MRTASFQKSLTELTRRRARTAFATSTLALAVASVSFLALPTLIDGGMQAEVRDGRLADATFFLRPVELSDAQLSDLAALPNVSAVEARSSVDARLLIGERRAPARVVGVRDLLDQQVDLVRLESGELPRPGEVISDVQNANVGVYDGDAGDRAVVLAPSGRQVEVAVSGRGRSLPGGEVVQSGVEVGDEVSLTTAGGTAVFTIVGTAKNQQENGTAIYVPLATARAVLDLPDGASSYWVKATTPDPASVDRTTAAVEDGLTALGYDVGSEVRYIAERDEVAANRTITTTLGLLGFVIVGMSMVGLANAITTNVLERTREIGILRSIGARARDVRRIFTTEGLVLALAGWIVGIPLGYALDRLLVRLVWEIADVRLPVVFPLPNLAIALAGTVVLALAVLALPVRRAARFRPGDALRHT